AFDTRVIRAQPGPNVLGVEILRAGGEAHEIDEQDRHDLSLLARGRAGLELLPARQAKTGPFRVLLTAARPNGQVQERTTEGLCLLGREAVGGHRPWVRFQPEPRSSVQASGFSRCRG